MAASITIGSLTLDTTGKILTGTLAGGSGTGYAPASAVTGLTIKQGGFILQPSSTAISGTTLTINLAAAGVTTTAVTLDVAGTSNLTDSAANTAVVTTNAVVTNNSTLTATNVAGNAANVVLSGMWTTSAVNSRTTYAALGANSQVDINVSLSAQADLCIAGYFFSANPFDVSIDGAAFTTPTIPVSSGTLTIAVLAASVSAGAHTLVIRLRSGASINIDQPMTLRFQGGVPTLSGVTTLGTATAGTTTGESRTQYYFNDPAHSPYIKAEGDINTASTAVGYSSTNRKLTQVKHPVSSFKARVQGTDLWAWTYAGGSKLAVRVNGADQGGIPPTVITLPNTSVMSWVKIATGLDGTQYQNVIVTEVTVAAGSNGGYYFALMPTGGTSPGIDLTTAQTLRTCGASYGDSITAVALGLVATEKGHSYLLSKRFNHAFFSDGVGGSQVSGASAQAGKNRTANITGATPAAAISYLVVHYGINDASNAVTLGDAATSNTFIGDCKLMLNSLLSGIPAGCQIIYLGLMGSSSKTWSVVSPYNTGIQTAIAACSAPGRVKFVDPSTQMKIGGAAYYTGGAFDTTNFVDGLHPNVLGYNLMDNTLAPHILSTLGSAAYSISGPASGSSGSASTAFTLTLGQSATFNSSQSVTLTASDGTITATAAGGSISGAGTGAVTVTPAAGATNFTFTYTPASGGNKTITPTNAQGWTDPAAVSYTAASSGRAALALLGVG